MTKCGTVTGRAQHGQTIFPGDAEAIGVDHRAMKHETVTLHHTFGSTGGGRGVEDGSERIWQDDQTRILAARTVVQIADVDDRTPGGSQLSRQRQILTVSNEDSGSAVL